jgi:hypothetical protein
MDNLNLKILCQAYEFVDHNLALSECNFFNDTAIRNPVGSEIDLVNYLISLDSLTFNKVTSDNSGDTPTPIYEYGDLKFKVTGIKNNHYLHNYFLLLDKTDTFIFRKYLIKLYVNNIKIFEGFIDNVSMKELYLDGDLSSELKEIPICAFSKIKEFREFYRSKQLPEPSFYFHPGSLVWQLPWNQDSRTEDADPSYNSKLCSSAPIVPFVATLFDNKFTVVGSYVIQEFWHICNIPQFFRHESHNSWFVPSGYKRWWQEGLNVMEFINYMCNAQGWILDFNLLNDTLTLKDRSAFDLPVKKLDFNKIKNLTLGSQSNKSINHIIIPDGTLRSKLYLSYAEGDSNLQKRFKIISNSAHVNNHTNFFQRVTGSVNNPPYHIWLDDNFKYSIARAESDKNYNYADVYITEGYWTHYHFINYDVPQNDLLLLNAGEQTAMKTVVDAISTLNYPALNVGESAYDILYSGNVGSAMCQRQYGEMNECLLSYHDYTKTDIFKNNYLSLLDGGLSKTIEIEYKELILDPNVTIEFENYNDTFFDSKFAINSLEVDFKNRVSTLLLVRQ